MKKFGRIFALVCAACMVLTCLTGCGQKVTTWEDAFAYDLDEHVKLGEYKGIEVVVGSRTATEEDVQEKIDEILEVYATYAEAEDYAACDRDRVVIDFVGKLNGIEFEGGTAKDYSVTIGEGALIAGFEEGLIGLKAGESTVLDLTFPDDYKNANLAGSDVTFDVTVKTVYKRNVPAFDDAFVSSNFEYPTAQAYKDAIIAEINETKPAEVEAAKREACWEQVMDNFTVFKIPATEAETYYDSNYYYYVALAEYQGMEFADMLEQVFGMNEIDFENMLTKISYETLEKNIVALAICREENLTVTKDIYPEMLDRFAVQWGYEDAKAFKKDVGEPIDEYYSVEVLGRFIFEQLAMDFVVENSIEIEAETE